MRSTIFQTRSKGRSSFFGRLRVATSAALLLDAARLADHELDGADRILLRERNTHAGELLDGVRERAAAARELRAGSVGGRRGRRRRGSGRARGRRRGGRRGGGRSGKGSGGRVGVRLLLGRK